MTKLIRCKQGHVFDVETHAECPVCGEQVVVKASNADGQETAPPPPAPTSPRIVFGALALLAVVAAAGGFLAFRPHMNVTPPETPIAAPASAEKKAEPSPTSGGETKPAPTEPPTAKQTLAPNPGPTGTDDSSAGRDAREKAALSGNAPTPTPTPTPAPLAIVDPATVGEWEFSVKSAVWILRIEPNGAYAFHAEPMNAAKPNSGVFSAEAGHWTMRANNGTRDGGAYSVESSDTLNLKGRLGPSKWRRVAGAPKSILGQMDPRTIGEWELPVGSGRWVWRVKADNTFEFRSEANDGVKPGEGSFSSMDGRWSIRAPNGYTDGGPYSFPTPDTFLATGHLGTGAWRRIPYGH